MSIEVTLKGELSVGIGIDAEGKPIRILKVETGAGDYIINLDPVSAAVVSRALSPPQGQGENGSVVALSAVKG